MARERTFKVLAKDNLREHRQVMVKIGDYEAGDPAIGSVGEDGKVIEVGSPKTVPADYWVPFSGETFQNYVLSLTGESLEDAWKNYVSAVDASARQSVRETAVADTTIIMVNGEKVDLMEKPLPVLIKAINGFASVAESTGKDMPNAFATARRRLLAAGTAKEVEDPSGDGSMVLALVK